MQGSKVALPTRIDADRAAVPVPAVLSVGGWWSPTIKHQNAGP
jgi:hypothetical protein